MKVSLEQCNTTFHCPSTISKSPEPVQATNELLTIKALLFNENL
jgi:hypothetical protein